MRVDPHLSTTDPIEELSSLTVGILYHHTILMSIFLIHDAMIEWNTSSTDSRHFRISFLHSISCTEARSRIVGAAEKTITSPRHWILVPIALTILKPLVMTLAPKKNAEASSFKKFPPRGTRRDFVQQSLAISLLADFNLSGSCFGIGVYITPWSCMPWQTDIQTDNEAMPCMNHAYADWQTDKPNIYRNINHHSG